MESGRHEICISHLFHLVELRPLPFVIPAEGRLFMPETAPNSPFPSAGMRSLLRSTPPGGAETACGSLSEALRILVGLRI